MLKIGYKFYTFEELIKRLDEFQRLEDVQLYLSDSQTISGSAKRSLRKSLNPLLKYSEITYSCVLKGPPIGSLKSSSGENCPFKVCLTASSDGRSLIVDHICHTHNHGKIGSLNTPVALDDEITEIYVDRNAETEAAKELIEFSHKEFRKRKYSENSNSPTKKVKVSIDGGQAPLGEGISITPVVILKNVKDMVRASFVSESRIKDESKLVAKSNCITKSSDLAKQNVVDVVSRKLNINSELTVCQNISSKELFTTANSSLSPDLNKEVKIPKIHAKTVAQINLEPENVKSADVNLEPSISCKDDIVSERNSNNTSTIVSNNSFPNTSFTFESKDPISYISNLQNGPSKATQEVVIIERPLLSKSELPVVEVDPLEDTSENGSDLSLKIENVFRTNEASFDSNQFHEDVNNFANSPHVNLLSMSDIYIGKGYPYNLFFFKCTSCKVSFNLEKDFVVHNRSPIHYKATMAERQSIVPDKMSHCKNSQKPTVAVGIKNCNKSTSNYKSTESSSSKGSDKIKSYKPSNKNKLKAASDHKSEVIRISNEIPIKNMLQPVPYIPLNLIKRRIIIMGELDNREEFIKQQKLKAKFTKMHNINPNGNVEMPIMFVPYQVKVRSAESGEFKFIVMYLPHFDTETSSKIIKDCWNIPENSWIGEVEEQVKSEVKIQFSQSSGAAMDEIKVNEVVAPVSDDNIIRSTSHKNNFSSGLSQKVNVKPHLDKTKVLSSNSCISSSNLKGIPNNGLKSSVNDISEAQWEKKHKKVSWQDQSSKTLLQNIKPVSQSLNTEASFMETLGLSSLQLSPTQIYTDGSDGTDKTSAPGSVNEKLDLYIDSVISNNFKITGIRETEKRPISLSKRENSTFMTQVPKENYLICQKYFPTEIKNIQILEQKFKNSDSDVNVSLSDGKSDHNPKDMQSSFPLKMPPNLNQPCRSSSSPNINKLISNPSPGTPNSIKIKPSEFRLLKIPVLKLRRIEKMKGENSFHEKMKGENSFNEGCKSKATCFGDVPDTVNLERCGANEISSKGNQWICSPTKNAVTDLKVPRFNNKSPPFHLSSTRYCGKSREVSDRSDIKASNCVTYIQNCGKDKSISFPKFDSCKELKSNTLPITAPIHSRNSHSKEDSKSSISKNSAIPDRSKSLSLVKHLEENSKFISALLRPHNATEEEYDHMPIFQNVETPVNKIGKFLPLSPNQKENILKRNNISVKSLASNESQVNECYLLSPSEANKHKIALLNKVLNKMSDVQYDDSLSTPITDQTNKNKCTNLSSFKSNKMKIDIVDKVSCDPSTCNASLDVKKHNLVNSPSTATKKDFEGMNSDADADLNKIKDVCSQRFNKHVNEEELNRKSISKTNDAQNSFVSKVKENEIGDLVYSKTMRNSSLVDKSLDAISKAWENSKEDFNLETNSNTEEVIEDKLLNEVDKREELSVENNSISYISLLNDMDYNDTLSSKFEAPDISKEEVLKSKDSNLAVESISVPQIKKPICKANIVTALISEINKLQCDSSKNQGCESSSDVSFGIKHMGKLKETSNHKVLTKAHLDANAKKSTGCEKNKKNSSVDSNFHLKDKIESALTLQPALLPEAANATQMKPNFSGTILKVRRNSLTHSIIKISDVIRRSDSPTIKNDNFKDRIVKATKVIGLSCGPKTGKAASVSNELLKKGGGVDGNIITIKTSLKASCINRNIKKSLEVISKPVCKQLQHNSGDINSEESDIQSPKVIVVSGTSKREPLPSALTPIVVEIATNVNKLNPTSSVQVINANYGNGDLPCLNPVFSPNCPSEQLNVLENSGSKYSLEASINTDEGSKEAKLCVDSTMDNSIKSKVSRNSSISTPNSSPKVFESLNEESLNRFHYKDSDNDDQRDAKFEEEDYVDKIRDNSTPGDNLSLVDENEWQDNLVDFETGGEDGYCRLLQDM